MVRHTERSVYSTLSVLDTLKSRKFHSTVRTWQCVTLMGCFIYLPSSPHGINRVPCGVVGVSYKTISVGSALLVLLCWAMREPQGVGRATSTDLHAFLCMPVSSELISTNAEAGRSIGKAKTIKLC